MLTIILFLVIFAIVYNLFPRLNPLFKIMISAMAICLFKCDLFKKPVEKFMSNDKETKAMFSPKSKDNNLFPSKNEKMKPVPSYNPSKEVFNTKCDRPYIKKDYRWNSPGIDNVSQWGCGTPASTMKILEKQSQGRRSCNLVNVPRWDLCV